MDLVGLWRCSKSASPLKCNFDALENNMQIVCHFADHLTRWIMRLFRLIESSEIKSLSWIQLQRNTR